MKTLVVFESSFGNTARLARAIARTLERAGPVRIVDANDGGTLNVEGIDLLIVGGPTQRHAIGPELRALLAPLSSTALHGVAVATFDTRYQQARLLTGSAAVALADLLRHKGAWQMTPPKSFFVADREGPLLEGELARAEEWAATMLPVTAAP